MKRIILFVCVFGMVLSMTLPAQAKGIRGTVYAMTNADENEIVVYNRAANGSLTLAGSFDTGGSGATTEPNDALGASNPLILSPDYHWLFAVNAGSDEISVFKIDHDGLTLMQVISSGGDFPVSLTIHRDLLYVLNAGGEGNITGFSFNRWDGLLTQLADSTRSLEAGGTSPPNFLNSPAQVGFSPLGDKLVITVKGALTNEPKIHVYTVGANGLPSELPNTTDYPDVSVSFGFVFDDLNNLIVAEPFGDGFPPPGTTGAVSSYRIAGDGSLIPISITASNEQVATCWIAITTDTRFVYSTNNGGDGMAEGGTISSYRVRRDGSLSLISKIAARTGNAPVDLAISGDNRYLYNVNAGSGTVSMFKINQRNGGLIPMGEIGGLPDDGSAVGIVAR